jgi:hypothetical protein
MRCAIITAPAVEESSREFLSKLVQYLVPMWVADWYIAFNGFDTDVLVNRFLKVLIGTLLTDVVKE